MWSGFDDEEDLWDDFDDELIEEEERRKKARADEKKSPGLFEPGGLFDFSDIPGKKKEPLKKDKGLFGDWFQ